MVKILHLDKGATRKKRVLGIEQEAFPILACEEEGMCLGIISPESGAMWMSKSPKLITSYRGMKIAEELEEIEEETLSFCWKAGDYKSPITNLIAIRKIEKQIGKQKRKDILKQTPENLEGILERINEAEFPFSPEEIEEEIHKGNIKPTDDIYFLLEKQRGITELKKQEKYGRVIDIDEAQKEILSISPSDLTGRFVKAYFLETTSPRVAIKHRTPLVSEIYIISKDRLDRNIEVTLEGGTIENPLFGKFSFLKIDFEYGGNEANFKPINWKEFSEAVVEKPSLFTKKYNAYIFLEGGPLDNRVDYFLKENRLRESSQRTYATLRKIGITDWYF